MNRQLTKKDTGWQISIWKDPQYHRSLEKWKWEPEWDIITNPLEWIKIKKTHLFKFWRRCGRNEIRIHWWECDPGILLLGTSLWYFVIVSWTKKVDMFIILSMWWFCGIWTDQNTSSFYWTCKLLFVDSTSIKQLKLNLKCTGTYFEWKFLVV